MDDSAVARVRRYGSEFIPDHVDIESAPDPQLISNIRNSGLLNPPIRQLALSRTPTPTSSIGTPRSHHSASQSYADTETGEGQGEIQLLARRILEFVDGDVDGGLPRSVTGSHIGGSSLGSSNGREHEELKRSVREALSGSHH